MENSFATYQEIRRAGERFFEELADGLQELGIPVATLPADHLCFRVATLEAYEFYRGEFSRNGRLLTEAPVNGRPICTFRLHEPLRARGQAISLLELPAPKAGVPYATGFEHAEFVIRESFRRFEERYPHVDFQFSGHSLINPELTVRVGARQAKFHHLALDRVIEIEEADYDDIVFDLDGTLVRSREQIYEINRRVFSEATGRDVSVEEAVEKFHPEFKRLFEAFGVSCAERKRAAIERWGALAREFTYELFDGVDALLESLSSLGYRLHLWTARDEASARAILDAHGIADHFTSMSFADDILSKPHPDSLRFEWRTAGKAAIVIGDSPSDVRGARSIQALSIGALWDRHAERETLLREGAELLVETPESFGKWLREKRRRGL